MKIVLHAYNSSCIQQMCINHTAIIEKGIENQYNFIVVLGNGLVLLRMPGCDCEQLTVNCQTTGD